jgi:hypothetical protein
MSSPFTESLFYFDNGYYYILYDFLRPIPVQRRAVRKPASPALCRAVLVRQHSQKQRISAGACRLTAPTRWWKIRSLLFAQRQTPHKAHRTGSRSAH